MGPPILPLPYQVWKKWIKVTITSNKGRDFLKNED